MRTWMKQNSTRPAYRIICVIKLILVTIREAERGVFFLGGWGGGGFRRRFSRFVDKNSYMCSLLDGRGGLCFNVMSFAVFHQFHGVPVHSLALASVFDPRKSAEEKTCWKKKKKAVATLAVK